MRSFGWTRGKGYRTDIMGESITVESRHDPLVPLAYVLGRSKEIWDELKAAQERFGPGLIVATKRAGRDYDGPVDHWASFHPELFEPWLAERRRHERPEPGMLWTGIYRRNKLGKGCNVPLNHIVCDGGASGLLGTFVALTYAEKVILCGIPMEQSGRYDDSKVWAEAHHHRLSWEREIGVLQGRVKSMSGWTRQTLGGPTEEWLSEGAVNEPASAEG